MAPYVFKLPASPHLASRAEKNNIDINRIKKSLTVLSRRFVIVIVEGTGGLLVPLNEKSLMIDVVKKFDLPVLLVAGNRLGAINHALLSIEALRSRGIKIMGVIFNNISKGDSPAMLKDNIRITKKLTGVNVFGTLPYTHDPELLRARFQTMARKIAVEL
jgi:dethiobiotin synthetase